MAEPTSKNQDPEMTERMDLKEAAEALQLSVGLTKKLIAMERLEKLSTRPSITVSRSRVMELVADISRHKYVSTKEQVDFSLPFGIAVPVTDPELGPSLYLDLDDPEGTRNGDPAAIAELTEIYKKLPASAGLQFTAWWPVKTSDKDALVSPGVIILGVTSGIVFDAAEIVDPGEFVGHLEDDAKTFVTGNLPQGHYTHSSMKSKKAFLVRPLAVD